MTTALMIINPRELTYFDILETAVFPDALCLAYHMMSHRCYYTRLAAVEALIGTLLWDPHLIDDGLLCDIKHTARQMEVCYGYDSHMQNRLNSLYTLAVKESVDRTNRELDLYYPDELEDDPYAWVDAYEDDWKLTLHAR